MAMTRTASPWWLSAILLAGLAALFVGERALDTFGGARFLSIGGLMLILTATALRIWAFAVTRGARRRVEAIFLACHAGIALGLIGYWFTTPWTMHLLGIDALDKAGLQRYLVPMTVLYCVILAISLLPLLMVELSLGVAQRGRLAASAGRGHDEAVELVRVLEMSTSGLSIALAAGFLMVTCNIAEQRNVRGDLSYFKTSSPGPSTVKIARSISEPLEVLLFFPESNQVGKEVQQYFKELARRTGNVNVEMHDRMVSATLARKHRITSDGTIIISRGDKSEKLAVSPDFQRARRTELRTFDAKVNTALLKVVRARHVAYFTVGHGELNDPSSLGQLAAQQPEGRASITKRILEALNYSVQELGLAQGLASEVPGDATLVVMLAPRTPLRDEELATLDRYLERGGAMLIALDPDSEARLGPLGGRLGLDFDPTPLTDDREHLRQRGNSSDRRLILTNQFSAHASTTTLSRASARAGIVVANSGSLSEAPPTAGADAIQRTFVIRSTPNAWADLDNDLEFDSDTETRARYNIAAAVEATPAGEGNTETELTKGMRAVVVADGDLFGDPIQQLVPLSNHLLADSVMWLGGEEDLAGETISEEDVLIKHSESEDVILLYSSIVGAPLLILGFGLGIGYVRRRRNARRTA